MARPILKIYTFKRTGTKVLRCIAYDTTDAVQCAMHLKRRYRYSPLVVAYHAISVLTLDADDLIEDPERTEARMGMEMRDLDERKSE